MTTPLTSFSLQNIPIDHCLVCTLRCTCSKCVLKAECLRQNVSTVDVVIDGLYNTVQQEVDNRNKGGNGGVGRKKHKKKKKGWSVKAKINRVSGQAMRGTGPAAGGGGGLHDIDGTNWP